MVWSGDKPFDALTAEEREKIRADRRKEHGGAECNQCGVEDYEDNLTKQTDGRLLCDNCVPAVPVGHKL
jgi:hypothetical protein